MFCVPVSGKPTPGRVGGANETLRRRWCLREGSLLRAEGDRRAPRATVLLSACCMPRLFAAGNMLSARRVTAGRRLRR